MVKPTDVIKWRQPSAMPLPAAAPIAIDTPVSNFAERFGIRRQDAGDFFDELQQLTEQESLRCGEFVLPGIAKLVVQKRERRMGHNPATGASVEIPAKQVVKARIAKPLKDVVEA